MKGQPVVVVPYDSCWPQSFAALSEVLVDALQGLVLRIEHVGSTAVPGLAAKPILDMDAVIPSRTLLPQVTTRLTALGYEHVGDLGIREREAFSRGGRDSVPLHPTIRRWPAHNLYVCAEDCPELHKHLRFRDWLRADAGRATAYGALKIELARRFRNDRDAYTEAKNAFITGALAGT